MDHLMDPLNAVGIPKRYANFPIPAKASHFTAVLPVKSFHPFYAGRREIALIVCRANRRWIPSKYIAFATYRLS